LVSISFLFQIEGKCQLLTIAAPEGSNKLHWNAW
jgi:hypothetical protein